MTDTRERDAWGLTVSSTGSTATPFGFVGGQDYRTDPDSGLLLLGARDYDPSVGRFLSRDPLRYGGGDVNLYRYCNNNPVNATDPTGKIVPVVAIVAVGLVFVAAVLVRDADATYRELPSFSENCSFLGDFFLGTGESDRYYPPGDPHSDQLRDSFGGNWVRAGIAEDRAAGRDMEGGVGTWLAFFNSMLEYNPTQGQVGGFMWSATENGDGTATVAVENVAGAPSFFIHAVPDVERGPRPTPFGSIHQRFEWIEPLH